MIADPLISEHILDYLKEKVPNFTIKKNGKDTFFTCPSCSELYCNFMGKSSNICCMKCNFTSNIINLAKIFEYHLQEASDNTIISFLKEKYSIKQLTEQDTTDILQFYKSLNFDMTPILKDGKRPVEREWTTQNHTTIEEWERWLKLGLNMGVKTGNISNIIVLDFDSKELPEIFNKYLDTTLVQKTKRGYHFFFQYEKCFDKIIRVKDDTLCLDVQTNGAQVVVYPSVVDGGYREINKKIPIKMPTDVIGFITQYKTKKIEMGDTDFQKENNFVKVGEGNRNSTLLSIGGVLRKNFNAKDTKLVLNLINNNFVTPKYPESELNDVINSLSAYNNEDDKKLADRVYHYIKLVEECTANDIKLALEENKGIIDKCVAWLVREGLVYRKKRMFHAIQKVDWQTNLTNIGKPISFKMPYFNDIANFNWGDLILLGGGTKSGKTHIAVNIIKDLIEQGVCPHYIYLEPGSRFAEIALKMQIQEGEFKHHFAIDPTALELEDNAVTIIDWLMVDNKAETDIIFRKLIEKGQKTNGVLIVFMQVKPNGDWFAPNMADLFPALAAKYFYEDGSNGSRGYWDVKPIRDSKRAGQKQAQIPCYYDWESKRLLPVTESEELKKPKIILPTINFSKGEK